MMKLGTWRHIAARQVRYGSLLRERTKALLLALKSGKNPRTMIAVGKVVVRAERHRRRMDRHMTKCAAMLKAVEDMQ